MKNQEKRPITDRDIERLRLGELPDEEAARLLSRLEEDGESWRLEESIAYDEAFLARYPASAAASQIRELARRRERKSASRSSRRPAIRAVVALSAVVAVIAVILLSLLWEPEPTVRELADDTPSEPVEVEDDESETAAVARDDAAPWPGMLQWLLEREEPEGPGALGCVLGETKSFDATGVNRVSTDRSEMLHVKTSDGGSVLQVTCKASGTATLSVFFEGDRPARNVIFRVAPPYYEPPAAQLDPEPRLTMALEECGDLQDMAVQLLIDRTGRPEMVMVGGGTVTKRACVRRAAMTFSAKPYAESDGYSIMSLEY